MPTAALVCSSCALQLVRGRAFEQLFAYKNPDGSAIDMTGMSLAGVMTWRGGSLDLTLPTPDSTGAFSASIDADDTTQVPAGQLVTFGLTITDTLGNTQDFEFPVFAVTPGQRQAVWESQGVITLTVQQTTVVITAAAQQGPAGPSGTGGSGGGGTLGFTNVRRIVMGSGGTTLTLNFTPAAGALVRLEINGVFQWPGLDYSLSGATVTFLGAGFAAGDTVTYGALAIS